jgi:hypothetical protein
MWAPSLIFIIATTLGTSSITSPATPPQTFKELKSLFYAVWPYRDLINKGSVSKKGHRWPSEFGIIMPRNSICISFDPVMWQSALVRNNIGKVRWLSSRREEGWLRNQREWKKVCASVHLRIGNRSNGTDTNWWYVYIRTRQLTSSQWWRRKIIIQREQRNYSTLWTDCNWPDTEVKHKGVANMEMTRKYNYMQFLLQNICYIRGAIFVTNGLCWIKVIRSLHNESSD